MASSRVRVVHVLNELKPSGTELMLHAAAPLWKRRGIESDILCTGEHPGPLSATLEADGFTIEHIPFLASLSFVSRVFEFLQRSKYDAVHVHTERGCIWYELGAYVAGAKSIIRTVHSVFEFSGLLRVRRAIGRKISRAIGVRTFAVGESVRECEMRRFRNPAVIVPNWFDERRFIPRSPSERSTIRAALGLSDELVIVSMAGVCGTIKNHESILRALPLISQKITYLHVGDDTKTGERALADRLHVRDRVRFVGAVPDPETYLGAADIYIMPSLYEGFGCAGIEAMAAGIPVVFSRTAGLSDFDSICPGIEWCDCSPESIASAIQRLSDVGDDARRNIGQILSQAVHQRFGTLNGAQRYADLYLEAARGGRLPL